MATYQKNLVILYFGGIHTFNLDFTLATTFFDIKISLLLQLLQIAKPNSLRALTNLPLLTNLDQC